jgi:hypothetical protein
MCACKETDMRESPNDSTLIGRERQGSRGEMCHPQYRESPIPPWLNTLYMWTPFSLTDVAQIQRNFTRNLL